ncbi:hypothetical protein [Peribacillus tepidiphilus]|uniref:hypothetical protein n=1 Tax=Peribacillus tepidiphilus TaxID=2652445 RepID=UPI0012915E28|nr:hypothetical protein [Peribacillus tepidiphilus]
MIENGCLSDISVIKCKLSVIILIDRSLRAGYRPSFRYIGRQRQDIGRHSHFIGRQRQDIGRHSDRSVVRGRISAVIHILSVVRSKNRPTFQYLDY